MATIYRSAPIDLPAATVWNFLDRYTRSEVHIFRNCTSERRVDDYRVVVTTDGQEIWERNVTVDTPHMRAVYTIPHLHGAEHHQAEMSVRDGGEGHCTLLWITDLVPHDLADQLGPVYDELFVDMISAVRSHGMSAG